MEQQSAHKPINGLETFRQMSPSSSNHCHPSLQAHSQDRQGKRLLKTLQGQVPGQMAQGQTLGPPWITSLLPSNSTLANFGQFSGQTSVAHVWRAGEMSSLPCSGTHTAALDSVEARASLKRQSNSKIFLKAEFYSLHPLGIGQQPVFFNTFYQASGQYF